jgi:hypothetical protein
LNKEGEEREHEMSLHEDGEVNKYFIKSKKNFTKLLLYIFFTAPCGLVGRIPGYRFRGSGSIPSATRFSEK